MWFDLESERPAHAAQEQSREWRISRPHQRNDAMKTIDVADLPEPVAEALAVIAQRVREQIQSPPPRSPRKRVTLRARPGTVLAPLTREEIYEDAC
jgi:hypothetical protein